MLQSIDDAVAGRLIIEPRSLRNPYSTTVLKYPPEMVVAAQVLQSFDQWPAIKRVARDIVDRVGVTSDEHDVEFHHHTDEEPFDGVRFTNAIGDDLVVSIDAFERLMARFFRAVIEGTPKNRPQDMRDPFWPEFVRITEELERRVAVQPANVSHRDR